MSPRETKINDRIFLNWFADVKIGTKKNFASTDAKTDAGALLQSSRRIERLVKSGYLREMESDYRSTDTRREVFYYPTKKAFDFIGRSDEYKFKEMKASSKIQHTSMEADIAFQFVRLFTNYDRKGYNNGCRVIIQHEPKIKGRKPDLLVTIIFPDGKRYEFWIEVEKKPYSKGIASEVFEKVRIFKSMKLSEAKLLIVLGGVQQAYITPQAQESHRVEVERLNCAFNRFIRNESKNYPGVFFLNWLNYYRLNESVIYSYGSPRKLIQ